MTTTTIRKYLKRFLYGTILVLTLIFIFSNNAATSLYFLGYAAQLPLWLCLFISFLIGQFMLFLLLWTNILPWKLQKKTATNPAKLPTKVDLRPQNLRTPIQH